MKDETEACAESAVNNIKCPRCASAAVYRYGKHRDHQRYICMLCHRQFIPGHERISPQWRPQCPECGNEMHIYMNKGTYTRFRCSAYPICKSFLVITNNNRRENELLHS